MLAVLRHQMLGLAGALVLSCASSCWAQSSSAPVDALIEGKEARSWLKRVQDAARQQNFSGTFVFSTGGAMSSAHIAHYCEGVNCFERIDSLDGQPRQVLRHNDMVHTIWPGSRLVMIEQRHSGYTFPSLFSGVDEQLFMNYEMRMKGVERVAGHDAHLIHMKARDGMRYGYRLWSDKSSGLLLRADVLNDRNEVLESSAFSEVTIGGKPQPEVVLMPMKKRDGYRVIKPQLIPTRLDALGWVSRAAVPGFKELNCFKRAMDDVALQDGSEPQAIQAIYSDGLTHVSLFIEPFNPARHVRPVLTVSGATRTLSRRINEWWITVVGDVPLPTLRAFSEGIERKN